MISKPPIPKSPVIVTGSRGRLASHLANSLVDSGVEVFRVSRHSGQGHFSYAELQASGLIYSSSAVIHCAWSCLPATAEENPEAPQIHDLPLLQYFMDIIAERPDPKSLQFIFLSSGGAIYGECVAPADETKIPAPVGAYGRGKVAAENMLSSQKGRYSPSICILRPSNLYGFRFDSERPQGIISAAINAANTGQPLKMFGGGRSVKDFIYIEDFESAILDCLRFKLTGIYNICSGISVRTSEVIQLIEEVGGISIPRVNVDDVCWDVHSSMLSWKKLSSETGWKPNWTLHEGLIKVMSDAAYPSSG